MNGYQEAPAGTVWEIVVNDTAYQVMKLDDGSYVVQGGEWVVGGCVNELAAMAAIIDREEARQEGP
ncbi:hypothetical protein ACIPSA_24065 [Streptomyces sp. NPDC086549]|uniref:hypothetical protein n=1 Tax=Streptomyces sp. NPDC086549 TaxID=3365752 RepID=UPI00381117AA